MPRNLDRRVEAMVPDRGPAAAHAHRRDPGGRAWPTTRWPGSLADDAVEPGAAPRHRRDAPGAAAAGAQACRRRPAVSAGSEPTDRWCGRPACVVWRRGRAGRRGACWCTGPRRTTTGRSRRASSTRASATATPRCARCTRRPGCAASSARSSPRSATGPPTGRGQARPLVGDDGVATTTASRRTTRSTSVAGSRSTRRSALLTWDSDREVLDVVRRHAGHLNGLQRHQVARLRPVSPLVHRTVSASSTPAAYVRAVGRAIPPADDDEK